MPTQHSSFLATRRGRLTLLLLCAVQYGELATAGVVLAAFAVTGLRRRDPLFPFSIFRTRGLAALTNRST